MRWQSRERRLSLFCSTRRYGWKKKMPQWGLGPRRYNLLTYEQKKHLSKQNYNDFDHTSYWFYLIVLHRGGWFFLRLRQGLLSRHATGYAFYRLSEIQMALNKETKYRENVNTHPIPRISKSVMDRQTNELISNKI